MDQKFKDMFSKAKEQAGFAIDVAGKKSKEVFEVSKSNVKIFDLNTEIEALYKEIGKLVYESHCGAQIEEETILKKVSEITIRRDEISLMREKKDLIKNTVICTNCETICNKADKFCTNCGMSL